MKTWAKIAVALGLLSLVACGGLPVSTDYDTSRDFTALKTFAWLEPSKKILIDPLVDNDLMNRRIKRSVERQLAAQGYSKASNGQQANFLVSYHVVAEDKLSITSFHDHYGYYPCWRGCYRSGFGGFGHSDIDVRQYKQGTFMIDIINPETKELMWRGVAGKRLSKGSPQQRDEYVNEIVTAILLKFPPSLTSN